VIKDYSPREIQRQRKVAEGELRNKYFREASPLKKRIAEIESELASLEVEFKDLETYFATPEAYGDAADITAKTKRHHELKNIIGQLTDEWAQISVEYEQKQQEFEEAKKELESGFKGK